MFATSLCLLLELEHILFFGPAGEGKNSISLSAVEVLRFQSEHQNIHCLLRFSIDHHPDHWSSAKFKVEHFAPHFFSLGLCEKSPNLTHPRFWSWISQVLIIQELHQKFKIQRNHIWMIPPQQFRYRGGSQIAGIDGFSPNMVQYSYRPIPYPDLLWVNFPYLPG